MKFVKARHPSPALVIASLALLVALSGTGLAAVSVMIPTNSVGTAQLKNAAVTAPKVKTHSLLAVDFKDGQLTTLIHDSSKGVAGPTGPTGPAGPSADWALVDPTGTVVSSSSGVTVSKTATGTYLINFGVTVAGDALIATPSNDVAGFRGDVVVEPCTGAGSAAGTCPVGGTSTDAVVFTLSANNSTLTNEPFYVVLLP